MMIAIVVFRMVSQGGLHFLVPNANARPRVIMSLIVKMSLACDYGRVMAVVHSCDRIAVMVT